tara:strand:- start:37111 stop:38727 length:1617 start_codon:yes stop_codon:yes gene_type:complete
MPVQLFENNATTLLDADILIGDTSLTVSAGEGALFPLPTAGDWFYATIQSGALIEIIQVTTRVTDGFTVIVRGQDGTSAAGWSAGATIELRTTKAWFDTVHTSNSLPAPGDVVGPASAVDSRVAAFDGTDGKLLKDAGVTISGSNTGDQTISDATISISDITTNDVSTTAHGFAPKGTNVGNFLKDDGTWDVPVSGTSVREPIINGIMNLWQRGTSFITPANGDFLADRWKFNHSSAGTLDISQTALTGTTFHTASGLRVQNTLRVDVNTIDASVDAGDFLVITQPIEGYRALPFVHNEFTISFYVRSNITGTYTFSVRNSIADKAFLKTFTIDVADTWERKTIVVPAQDHTGTWDYVDGIGIDLGWALIAGTTFHGTDDSWQNGNLFGVVGGTNFMATATNNFDLTGVQMDLGGLALPLRGMHFDEDLAAAQRYFLKSYNVDVDPAAVSTFGQGAFVANGVTHFERIPFVTSMRAAPTVTIYSPSDGATANVRDTTPTAQNRAATANSVGENGFSIAITTSVDGNSIVAHFTAEAEL